MQNIAFVSDDITIQLGDTVTWNNLDGVAHTATSTNVPAGGTPFDSGNMGSGASFTFVPNSRGDWIYFCELHPLQMVDARIDVQ